VAEMLPKSWKCGNPTDLWIFFPFLSIVSYNWRPYDRLVAVSTYFYRRNEM